MSDHPRSDHPRSDPSQPLANARHEEFAQAVAKGTPDAAAYRLAGFRGRESNKRASEIRARPGISERVKAIKAEANKACKLTKERALEILAEIVTTPIASIGPDHYLAQEVIHGEHGSRIKMLAKLDALKVLGAWCGWETGTQADNAAAGVLATWAEKLAKIRGHKKK